MRRNGIAFTHGEKKIGDAFITFYVAFIRRLRCVYRNRKKKCNLPPLVILVVVRELFRLGLDVMEPFSCSYSLCLARGKVVVVPVFNRVRKDWFDVCLCLWIVKTVVLPGLRYFHVISWRFCFYGMSLRRSGVGFSRLAMILSSHQLCSDSAQNKMKPTAPKVVRNISGASIPSDRLRRGDCVSLFLLGWRCDFDVVYDLVNTCHCSR